MSPLSMLADSKFDIAWMVAFLKAFNFPGFTRGLGTSLPSSSQLSEQSPKRFMNNVKYFKNN